MSDKNESRGQYEAWKERNKDWIEKTKEQQPRKRDDGYPEGLPFLAFDPEDDVESIEERTVKETLDLWADQPPSELEQALHRFERKRKAAARSAEKFYRNRMFESDVQHARTELRNWWAWNWKMWTVKQLLDYADIHGPKALQELAKEQPWTSGDGGKGTRLLPQSHSWDAKEKRRKQAVCLTLLCRNSAGKLVRRTEWAERLPRALFQEVAEEEPQLTRSEPYKSIRGYFENKLRDRFPGGGNMEGWFKLAEEWSKDMRPAWFERG